MNQPIAEATCWKAMRICMRPPSWMAPERNFGSAKKMGTSCVTWPKPTVKNARSRFLFMSERQLPTMHSNEALSLACSASSAPRPAIDSPWRRMSKSEVRKSASRLCCSKLSFIRGRPITCVSPVATSV